MCDLHEMAEELREWEGVQDDPHLIPDHPPQEIKFDKLELLEGLRDE